MQAQDTECEMQDTKCRKQDIVGENGWLEGGKIGREEDRKGGN